MQFSIVCKPHLALSLLRWQLDLPGKEHIVPQTLSYLLMRSMHESMTAASVKRVYAMREALVVLDWDDEDSEPLKVSRAVRVETARHPIVLLLPFSTAVPHHLLLQGILTQCFITPIFLSTTEGQRFCSYIMCLQYVRSATLMLAIILEHGHYLMIFPPHFPAWI